MSDIGNVSVSDLAAFMDNQSNIIERLAPTFSKIDTNNFKDSEGNFVQKSSEEGVSYAATPERMNTIVSTTEDLQNLKNYKTYEDSKDPIKIMIDGQKDMAYGEEEYMEEGMEEGIEEGMEEEMENEYMEEQ